MKQSCASVGKTIVPSRGFGQKESGFRAHNKGGGGAVDARQQESQGTASCSVQNL